MTLDKAVGYNPYNYNNGRAPRPELNWDGAVWVNDDTIVVTIPAQDGNGKEYFPNAIKEALENQICVKCGKKNCPYMKENKDYKKMLNELKKGHFDKARKIYKMKFSQFNSSSSDAINQSIQENLAAQEAANKSRENVLIETSEVLTSYGEAVSKQISKEFKSIADGIKNNIKNFQGKRIRTADQAVASLNKVLANPSMKINNTDKTAIINAWKHINMQDISNKFANLSRFFKVGDLALKAEKIRENMII